MNDFLSESNSDFYILNELNLAKFRGFGLIQDANKSKLRIINNELVIINKHHIESKNINNSRFPSDPDIKKYIAGLRQINNYEDHINFILDKTIKSKTNNIQKTIDNIMNNVYNKVIIGTGQYDFENDDVPFKLSVYNTFKWFDKSTNSTRFFKLEAALAVYGTFLTFNKYPLILIDEWDTRKNPNPFQRKIISSVNSCIANFKHNNGYDLFEINNNNNNNKIKINKDFLLKQQNYILYINGYSTWVKEVEWPKMEYMYNNQFNLATNKKHIDLKDLYKDIKNTKTNQYYTIPDIQTECVPFNSKNSVIEIDDQFYNKLFNFELNRYKESE